MTQSRPSAVSPSRLAIYTATAGSGVLVAGSAAHAGAVIVDITTVSAQSDFTINLAAAGSGGDYTFSNIGLTNHFYGRVSATNQPDSQQFVATNLVGNSEFLDSNDNWTGWTQALNHPAADTTLYLGFRLTVGEGDSRYGWIEYVNTGGSVTVSRWAYESALNTGISTPTAGSNNAVPGLGGLAALACGAAGVRRNRNRVA